ncbi:hypothetical protein [Mycolicibacterium palauense]|uniref:hypothetical protein n=1 Tax=Mycolicibacterium palauense TaxID=2034511 RepID=UPI00114577D1|nr:hypothetical protein [Mycolicibacterium palauense]
MTERSAGSINEALARLDADIAAAEDRLTQLRAMRASIQPFIELYMVPETRGDADSSRLTASDESGAASITDSVIDVFREREGETLDVDAVFEILREQGSDATRDQVRNALNYGVRLEKLDRGAKRGHFSLKSTSAPAATGADVNEEPNKEDSSGEIGGGRDSGSTLLHDQGGAAVIPPIPLDRVGDRAPIGG